jgi:hypothetical protein
MSLTTAHTHPPPKFSFELLPAKANHFGPFSVSGSDVVWNKESRKGGGRSVMCGVGKGRTSGRKRRDKGKQKVESTSTKHVNTRLWPQLTRKEAVRR